MVVGAELVGVLRGGGEASGLYPSCTVSFLSCFSFLPPPKLGQYEGVIIVTQYSCFFSRWFFVFCCVTWPLSLYFTPSSPALPLFFLWLPGSAPLLTKIGKKVQSIGQRSLENNVLMDFLFGLFAVTAALPKQAFQEHSAVWDVILIRNTVENSTLPLDKNPGYHPPVRIISQASFYFTRE